MLQKSNAEKLLDAIFAEPIRKFTVRELARTVNMAPPTALRIVAALKKEGIIRDARIATASQISANLESKSYYKHKLIANLQALFFSGLVEHLVQAYHDPRAIILFGSYCRGEDIERSDIDIAVLTSKHITNDLTEFEKKLHRTISIHEINLDKVSSEFKNNLYNGIVLRGAL